MAENYAQIQPDSTGDKVRTYTVTTLVDGTLTDVDMQIVTIADVEGRVLPLVDGEWRQAVLARLDLIAEILTEAFLE